MSVARRVSEEFGCRLGSEVGYTIRFEDVTRFASSALFRFMNSIHHQFFFIILQLWLSSIFAGICQANKVSHLKPYYLCSAWEIILFV